MMKPVLVLVLITVASLAVSAGCAQVNRESIYQVSTIGALMQGVYEGSVKCGELPAHGNVGLGTFEALDGELVMLDGRVYQVKLDGTAREVPADIKTSFAAVTFLDVDKSVTVDKPLDLNQLQAYLDSLMPTANLFYAIRIDGVFPYMKTRSVPAQSKPYPPLAEAVKNQKVTEFSNVEGTMIGFRCPPYAEGVNVPGYHFHFLDKDRKMGGHVLDCRITGGTIKIDYTPGFEMVLPESDAFYRVNLGQDAAEGLQQVEKGK